MNDGKIFFHEVGLNPGWAKHNKHVIIDKKIIFYFQEKYLEKNIGMIISRPIDTVQKFFFLVHTTT